MHSSVTVREQSGTLPAALEAGGAAFAMLAPPSARTTANIAIVFIVPFLPSRKRPRPGLAGCLAAGMMRGGYHYVVLRFSHAAAILEAEWSPLREGNGDPICSHIELL
jgi:hypothetical protein